MRGTQTHNGYFVVFDRGEEIISALAQFADNEDMHWGAFEALGMAEDVEIGYYDLEAREYVYRQEEGPFEVVSFKGNITQFKEVSLVHAHAALARCDESLEMIGGHVRSMRVAATLEMILWEITQPLRREFDDDTGLNIITMVV